MSRKDQIIDRLTQAFAPHFLEVRDESYKHAGHPGVKGTSGETHFHIVMESPVLEGLTPVERHRQVNDCLKEMFSEGLHALRLELKAAPKGSSNHCPISSKR